MRVDIHLWWRSGGDSTLGKAKRLQDEAGQREPPGPRYCGRGMGGQRAAAGGEGAELREGQASRRGGLGDS